MSDLPGMTRCVGDVCQIIPSTHLKNMELPKKTVIISSAVITNESLFRNGLNQNIIIFYRLFEAMGLAPMILMSDRYKSDSDIPEIMKTYKFIVTDDITKNCIPISYFIEVGMSIDAYSKSYFKMIGARLIKVYLGNIVNIDIETSMFYPDVDFPHHIVSGHDLICVSPHYGQNAEYAVVMNHGKKQSQNIAPYVWDPFIISSAGCRLWRPREASEEETVVIMEPNISFQKSCIVQLLAIEKWYRKNRDWKGKVFLYNSDRPMQCPHFQNMYMKKMALFKDNKIKDFGRCEIVNIMQQIPHATFITHQVNNEFNYLLLELFWCGFPVVHNVQTWKEFGYFYPDADLDMLTQVWRDTLDHKDRTEVYKGHAQTLAWRYSPYNPAIQEAWTKLLS